MPRKCTGCDYTTDDPFLGTCPWCSRSLAIVSRGGNRQSARVDWRRERPRRRLLARPEGGWVRGGWGVWLMVALVVGGLFYTAVAGGRRADRPRAATGSAGRVRAGMSLRDAVLALEPTPTADGRVSLHDLLDTPDASGTFTYCDNSPIVRVTFRRGRVTGVSELDGRFMPGVRQVDIQLDPGEP